MFETTIKFQTEVGSSIINRSTGIFIGETEESSVQTALSEFATHYGKPQDILEIKTLDKTKD